MAAKKTQLTGVRFGSLVVGERVVRPNNREPVWMCQCDCGNTIDLPTSKLKRGHKSCKICYSKTRGKHRMCGTKEYRTWVNIIQRCTNPKSIRYEYYGGAGISVCQEWLESFENFYKDMGNAPSKKHSVDRFPDKNGHYEPGNCRWATDFEQSRNKSSNKMIVFNGEEKCLADWAHEYGLEKRTLCGRLLKGWSVEKAITTPVLWSRKK